MSSTFFLILEKKAFPFSYEKVEGLSGLYGSDAEIHAQSICDIFLSNGEN